MSRRMAENKREMVAVVYGGRSGEHEVSCKSAEFVYTSLLDAGYEAEMVKFEKNGAVNLEGIDRADVIFPVIHGTYGEDGCLQGLLEMFNKPYVGAGVLGSAIGMDKDVQKRLMRDAGIQTTKYWVIKKFDELEMQRIKFPVFVKPANLGSSVGISKCEDKKTLRDGVALALRFDTKVLVEEAVRGREIEVAILGDTDAGYEIMASIPGEVIPLGKHEFYDYEAKYIDENGAELMIPLRGLTRKKIREVQNLAIKTFSVLECRGIARVDMFLKSDGQLVVNEINTLPGFTSISMYPKLWAASGIGASELMATLIKMAITRSRINGNLQRSYQI